jgi:type II secretory pathway component PulM
MAAKPLNALLDAYKGMSTRERLMLGVALLAGLYFVAEQMLIQPGLAQQQQLQRDLGTARIEKQALTTLLTAQASGQAEAQAAAASSDPEAQERERLLQMARTLDDLNAQARENGDINAWLNRLLTAHGNRLVPTTIRVQGRSGGASAPATDKGMEAPEWRQVELVLEGEYAELMGFIDQLQHRPGLRWVSTGFQVMEHPRSQLSLVLQVAVPAL